MSITHRLVGYDCWTERVIAEHDVPDDLLPTAKRIAHVPADDPDAAMCYALADDDARELAGLLQAKIERDCDYFLEGFAANGE